MSAKSAFSGTWHNKVKSYAEYGIAAQGWFGQSITVMRDKKVTSVRLCDDSDKKYNPKYFFPDLPQLLRKL